MGSTSSRMLLSRLLPAVRHQARAQPQTFFARSLAAKGTSYYQTIKGVKYDRAQLSLADELAAEGVIGKEKAQALWKKAMDGSKVTVTEHRSMIFILEKHQFDAEARAYLEEQLSALPPLKTESVTRRKTSSQPAEAAEVDAIKVDAIKVDAIKRDMIKELFLHELAAVTQRLTEARTIEQAVPAAVMKAMEEEVAVVGARVGLSRIGPVKLSDKLKIW